MKHSVLLTPRSMYSMITGKHANRFGTNNLCASKTQGITLTKFWRGFLGNIVDDSILGPIFDTQHRRSRSLSVLMNRTELKSCTNRLYQGLESNLSVESFLKAVKWWQDQLDRELDVWTLADTITQFEEACRNDDYPFSMMVSFFQPFWRQLPHNTNYCDRQHFVCSLRLTWLSLHAIYGNQMVTASNLSLLRRSDELHPDDLWRRNYEMYASVSRALMGDQANEVALLTLPWEGKPLECELQESTSVNVLGDVLQIRSNICELMRSKEQTKANKYSGWYVVANWTDPHIALNDQPAATYKGAQLLRVIPNGTVLWIQSATGYEGLGNSSGLWGLTHYDRTTGYVPMNYMMKIRPE